MIVKNAKLRGKDFLHTIKTDDNGMIESIISQAGDADSAAPLRAGEVCIDAGGSLVIPPFVDPHVHLDAVLSAAALTRPNLSGTLIEAIDIWNEWKEGLTEEILLENARKVIKWYIANGVLYVRTHADCTDPGLLTVQSLVKLRDEMKDYVEIQITAFPQNGIFTKKNGSDLMKEAISLGADVVGGAPHIEYTREDGVQEIEYIYDLAERNGLLIDVHCDETGDPASRFSEVMARESIHRGMHGLATASHTTAMHNYNNDYAYKLINLLAAAEMNMIVNPFDNAVLQNRLDGYPRKRGITRVDEMVKAGINVCIGHDSIMDPWYSLGKGSMTAAANLLAHLGHMNGGAQMPILIDMVTVNSARTMCIENQYGIEIEKPATFIILDSKDETETIRLLPECLFVIKNGKVIAETEPARRRVTCHDTELVDFKH